MLLQAGIQLSGAQLNFPKTGPLFFGPLEILNSLVTEEQLLSTICCAALHPDTQVASPLFSRDSASFLALTYLGIWDGSQV